MKSKFFLVTLVCLAALTPAYAIPGSFNVSFLASPSIFPAAPPGLMGNATSFTIVAAGFSTVASGYFSTLGAFTPITFNGPLTFSTASAGSVVSLPVSNWASWTFNSNAVTFDLASYKITQTPPASNAGTLAIYLYGTYNDVGLGGSGTSTAAFDISFTQTVGNPVNESATFGIPAPPPTAETPEPATMGLLGASLVGLAVARRRFAKR